MVEGAAILLVGAAIGAVVQRLIDRAPRPSKPIKPICACRHSFGEHDPRTGRCQAREVEEINFDERLIQCACRRYTGPEPLPQYYAPEIASPPDGV